MAAAPSHWYTLWRSKIGPRPIPKHHPNITMSQCILTDPIWPSVCLRPYRIKVIFKKFPSSMNSSKSLVPTLQHHLSNYTTYESQQLNCSLQLLGYFLRSAASNLSEKRVTEGNFFQWSQASFWIDPVSIMNQATKNYWHDRSTSKLSHLKYINGLLLYTRVVCLFHHRILNCCIN